MKKNFLLAALLSVLSVGSSFSATTLQDTIEEIKTQISNTYNDINNKFNGVIIGWNHNVTFSGSLQEQVSLLKGAFNALDLSNATNLDYLAPTSTNNVRNGTYNTANKIIPQLIKAIGYTSLSSPITGWALIAAPVADSGKSMTRVVNPDPGVPWRFRIVVNTHYYDCSTSDLPITIKNGMSVTFSNSTYGNITFQRTGVDFASTSLYQDVFTSHPIGADWVLESAPIVDTGYPMSQITQPDANTLRITVNYHNYDLDIRSYPYANSINAGTPVGFGNGMGFGSSIVFRYLGTSTLTIADIPSSIFTNGVEFYFDTLKTRGISFVLPGSIFEAAQGLAQLVSEPTIGLNKDLNSQADPNFPYSAAQRLAAALNSAA